MKTFTKTLSLMVAFAAFLCIAPSLSAQLTVDAAGEVGVNTPSPSARLHITQDGTAINDALKWTSSAGNAQDWYFYMSTNDDLRLRDDASDVISFQNGTDFVGINTNAPTANLSVNGTANKTGGGSWAVFSDARVKRDIVPFNDGLEQILKIETVKFKYIDGFAMPSNPNKEFVGIIAQDMQKIAPYMVESVTFEGETPTKAMNGADQDATDENATNRPAVQEYLQYDPSALDYMLINAVKEQQQMIEDQQK